MHSLAGSKSSTVSSSSPSPSAKKPDSLRCVGSWGLPHHNLPPDILTARVLAVSLSRNHTNSVHIIHEHACLHLFLWAWLDFDVSFPSCTAFSLCISQLHTSTAPGRLCHLGGLLHLFGFLLCFSFHGAYSLLFPCCPHIHIGR